MWREGAPCAGGPGCRAPSRPPCVRRGTGVRGFASSRQPAAAEAGNTAAARAPAQSVRDRAPFAPPHVVDIRLPARAVDVVADGCGRPRLEDGGVVPAAGRALSTQRPCSARGLRVARAYHSPRWLASTSVFGRGSIRPRRPSALILSKGERDREHQVTGARREGQLAAPAAVSACPRGDPRYSSRGLSVCGRLAVAQTRRGFMPPTPPPTAIVCAEHNNNQATGDSRIGASS
jgi:hypothetical protein